jgi:hypothetical protein
MPNVQWKTPDDGQRNCPKHVEFLDKNKFGKLVRLLVLLKMKHVFVLNFQNSPVTIRSLKMELLYCLETIGTVLPAMLLNIAERDSHL